MRRGLIGGAALLLAVLIGLGLWLWLRPPPLASGPLVAALAADPRSAEPSSELTSTFDRFLPHDIPLERKRDILAANGFTCALRPAMVERNRELSCERDAGSDLFCQRVWRYFQYDAVVLGRLDRPLGVKRTSC